MCAVVCRPAEQLEEIFKVNFLGTLLVTRAFLPLLLAGKQRKIVNISTGYGSIQMHASLISRPNPSVLGSSNLGYASSKAALNMRKFPIN